MGLQATNAVPSVWYQSGICPKASVLACVILVENIVPQSRQRSRKLPVCQSEPPCDACDSRHGTLGNTEADEPRLSHRSLVGSRQKGHRSLLQSEERVSDGWGGVAVST